MATAAATTKSKTKAAEEAAAKAKEAEEAGDGGAEGGADNAQQAEADKVRQETEEQLEILESKIEPKRWVIGKPPEQDGTEDEYSIYTQRPLGYMARMRFFSLVSSNIADAIKSGGQISFGGSDIFGSGGGSLRTRAAQLSTEDFADAASFMALAMQLISYAPDFLLDCYVLWLDVPPAERQWAKIVMDQKWDPERNKWGLSDEVGLEMIEVFIDQNYEDIRDFFVVKLPQLAQRVREREAQRQARESGSAQSKQ